ncbi:MAG: DUF1122 family protein [Thermoplasmatales archaeon]|nr:MAG: DUF1122 family protein [Thermoplasmatales archaeon]
MLKKTVEKLAKGLRVNRSIVHAKNVKHGRLRNEVRLHVSLKKDDKEEELLDTTVYYGLKPYYRPWVEFSNINNNIMLGNKIEYFNSKIEDYLLNLFSNSLGPGETIYVAYYSDKETAFGLNYGIPPPITRLGYKLFNLGFTWFKDWYFPEGGSEGGQKLQGEKPLNIDAKKRHLTSSKREILNFMDQVENFSGNENYSYVEAKDRAVKILNKINEVLD